MTAETSEANLITNPGFEADSDGQFETAPGWCKSPNLNFATYQLDGETRRTGRYSQRITSKHLDLPYVYQRVPVMGGRTYRVSVWVKVSGDASAMFMAIQGDAEARGVGARRVDSDQVAGDSEWRELSATVSTTETCALLTLILRMKTIGERGGTVWFDDAALVEDAARDEQMEQAVTVTRAETGDRPALVPAPKRLSWRTDVFRLSPTTPLLAPGGPNGPYASAIRELNEEMRRRFGFALPVRASEELTIRGEQAGQAILLTAGENAGCGIAGGGGLFHPESYTLTITSEGVQLSGLTTTGVFWGVQTLKSLLWAKEGGVWLWGAWIEDWPDHSFRGIHFCPDASAGTFYVELIEKVLARYRFNHIVLESQYSNWESHSELHDPRMAGKRELAQVIAAARAHHIEVTPLIQSLGHMDWMFRGGQHLDLVEDPEARWAYNPLNPRSYDFIFDIMEEALDLFRPRRFHIGHDEVRYEGRFPYSEEGQRLGFAELFLRDTLRLHSYLTGRGVEVMLWGDELQRPDMIPHLHRFPRDLIIVDWNYNVFHRYPNVPELMARGFRVIGSTWSLRENIASFARFARDCGAMGMLQTTWTRDHTGSDLLADEFPQFAAWIIAGDHFWNASRDEARPRYDAGRLLKEELGR